MNRHKNARLTFEGRKLLIERIAGMGLMPAAEVAGISVRTARKWRDRFNEQGLDGLLDRSSRPANTRTSLDARLRQRIEQLRRSRMPMRRIAAVVGRSVATVSRQLERLGLSRLKALDPREPVVRYEHLAPGEKKLSAVGFLKVAVAHDRALGGDHQAPDHRQRTTLSFATICAYLPGPGHQAHLHPPLPFPDQRQG